MLTKINNGWVTMIVLEREEIKHLQQLMVNMKNENSSHIFSPKSTILCN